VASWFDYAFLQAADKVFFYFPEIQNVDKSTAGFFAVPGVSFPPVMYDNARTACAGFRKFGSNDQNLLQNIPSDVD
jgi:hypothetical protein